jgi:hypothetical protein
MMIEVVKNLVLGLIDGISPLFRGMLLTLSIVLIFMWATGFNYKNLMIAQEVGKEESILLSNRSSADENAFSNNLVEEVHDITGAYGVALFGLEPEYIPKIIHVIARDGSKDFENYIDVGNKYHISSTIPETFMSLREGLTHRRNLSDLEISMSGGTFKSFITHPICYRGITVGSLTIFLENVLEDYSEYESRKFDVELRMACVSMSEEFYYSRSIK